MVGSKTFAGLLMLAVACSTATGIVIRNRYEETISYFRNPQCRPSRLDRGIQCSAIGSTIELQGGMVCIFQIIFFSLTKMEPLSNCFV